MRMDAANKQAQREAQPAKRHATDRSDKSDREGHETGSDVSTSPVVPSPGNSTGALSASCGSSTPVPPMVSESASPNI